MDVDWTLALLQWTVQELGGEYYTLTIGGGGRPLFVQDSGGQLVGSETPPSSIWSIRSQNTGVYTLVPVSLSLSYIVPDIRTEM